MVLRVYLCGFNLLLAISATCPPCFGEPLSGYCHTAVVLVSPEERLPDLFFVVPTGRQYGSRLSDVSACGTDLRFS